MTTVVRTPLAEWRQEEDGSWTPVPLSSSGARTLESGNPGGGSDFLTPDEIIGGDNILITDLPGGSLLIEQGGHRILYQGVAQPFQRQLDFQGSGVEVTDDAVGERTVVTIGGPGSGALVWRDVYDSGALYSNGDVVSFEDALFVFTGTSQGYGFGLGPFGEGPFGGTEPEGGWGATPFGSGPFGG